VNDAPALALADVSFAVADRGSDIAIDTADITLYGGGVQQASDAMNLSRQVMRTIKQNLFLAFAYNVACVPLAAFGVLPPAAAAGAMALSSLSVVGNALRLRRFKVDE